MHKKRENATKGVEKIRNQFYNVIIFELEPLRFELEPNPKT